MFGSYGSHVLLINSVFFRWKLCVKVCCWAFGNCSQNQPNTILWNHKDVNMISHNENQLYNPTIAEQNVCRLFSLAHFQSNAHPKKTFYLGNVSKERAAFSLRPGKGPRQVKSTIYILRSLPEFLAVCLKRTKAVVSQFLRMEKSSNEMFAAISSMCCWGVFPEKLRPLFTVQALPQHFFPGQCRFHLAKHFYGLHFFRISPN